MKGLQIQADRFLYLRNPVETTQTNAFLFQEMFPISPALKSDELFLIPASRRVEWKSDDRTVVPRPTTMCARHSQLNFCTIIRSYCAVYYVFSPAGRQ